MATNYDINLAGSIKVDPTADPHVEGEERHLETTASTDGTVKLGFVSTPVSDNATTFSLDIDYGVHGDYITYAEQQYQRDAELSALQAQIDALDPSEDAAKSEELKAQYDKLESSELGRQTLFAHIVTVRGGLKLFGKVPLGVTMEFDEQGNGISGGLSFGNTWGGVEWGVGFTVNDEVFKPKLTYKGPITSGVAYSGNTVFTFPSFFGEASPYASGFDGVMAGILDIDNDGVPFAMTSSGELLVEAVNSSRRGVVLGLSHEVVGNDVRNPDNSDLSATFGLTVHNSQDAEALSNDIYYGDSPFQFRNAGVSVGFGNTTTTSLHHIEEGSYHDRDFTTNSSLELLASAEFGFVTQHPFPKYFRPVDAPAKQTSASSNPLSVAFSLGATQTWGRGNGYYTKDLAEVDPFETAPQWDFKGFVMLNGDIGVDNKKNRFPK